MGVSPLCAACECSVPVGAAIVGASTLAPGARAVPADAVRRRRRRRRPPVFAIRHLAIVGQHRVPWRAHRCHARRTAPSSSIEKTRRFPPGTHIAQPGAMHLSEAPYPSSSTRREFCCVPANSFRSPRSAAACRRVAAAARRPVRRLRCRRFPARSRAERSRSPSSGVAIGDSRLACCGDGDGHRGDRHLSRLRAHGAGPPSTTVTAVCTHEACAVTGDRAATRYVCPCHGSQYTTSGAVVQGPAVSPLREFPTIFANNVVTISV